MRAIANKQNILEWAAFFMVAILGFGSSFYWIKVAVSQLTPVDLIAYRACISASFLWSAVYILRTPLPKTWELRAKVMFAGVLGGALPNTLISWGELYIDSSIAAILIGLCPTFTALFSALWLRPYELTPHKVLGIIVGFMGIYAITNPNWVGNSEFSKLLPQCAIVVAAMCYSFFSVFAKKHFQQENAISLAAFSATASGVSATSIALWQHGAAWSVPHSGLVWMAVLWIGIVTSATSQILVYYLVNKWGPAKLSMISYVMPLVALGLGIVLLEESPSYSDYFGGLLVILSIYLISSARKMAAPPAPSKAVLQQ